jgi:hypothetical protein
MGAQEDAVFSVLNDWLDLDQDHFLRLWPELKAAVERTDPKGEYAVGYNDGYDEGHTEGYIAGLDAATDSGDNYTGPTYMEFDD